MELLRFLFSQYKIGVVEGKGSEMREPCLVNVGMAQGGKVSCGLFLGV